MSDKELLELAAKAIGKAAWWSPSLEDWQKDLTPPYVDGVSWDPLTDDGDALRLAVKLHMQVSITTESCRAETLPVLGVRVNDKDEMAATRRAIVKAAAAIGETFP